MKTLLTGATGFVGSALARKLAERGEDVVCLVRKGSDTRNLDGVDIRIVNGDLRDAASVMAAMDGCSRVYHAAADYRLWTADKKDIYEINVGGTKNILDAAKEIGVERVVYTSTVGALGNPGDGTPGNEDTKVSLSDMTGDYKRSKFMAEQLAHEYAADGHDIVIVNPSTPVGPRDVKPTPTGQMIVDFLNGKMVAYLDTGLNLIDVEDAAIGHILAMERGRSGNKYILGNRDMSLREIFELLSRLTGIPAPRVKLPFAFVYPISVISTAVSDYITKKPPLAPVDAVKMARKIMFFDQSKAVTELGLPQSPVENALMKAVDWFYEAGYARRVNGR